MKQAVSMGTDNLPAKESPTPKPLLHHWIVAGIVSASARFIPIPFVDDVVRDQCRRYVVSRTLSANGSDIAISELKPFYASGGGGCLAGCIGTLAKAPVKLLLFPVRKIMALVTSVRGVPMEVMRMVLLGRTLDRYLRERNVFATVDRATKMRTAFDDSFARMDFRVVRAAIADALSSISGWKSAAIKSAEGIAGPKDAEKDGLNETEAVAIGANQIEEVLQRPETLRLFAEFDQRFDETLAQLT